MADDLSQVPEIPAPAHEAVEPPTERESIEDSVRAAFATETERVRDEKGRFAPKPADEAPEAAAPVEAKPISDRDVPAVAQPAPSTAPAGPPPGWSPEAKAHWSKLPPALQQAVIKRETEVSDGFRQKSEEAKAWTPLKEILEPRAQQFASVGTDAPGAIKQLLGFWDAYLQQPADLIRHLAKEAGIDLRQLVSGPTASASPAAAVVPRAQPVPDVSTVIRQELDSRDAQRMLADFVKDPTHKHANDPTVRRAMAAALQTGAKDLNEAYDQAVWALRATRDTLLADRDAAEAKAKTDKAEAARKASVSLRGGSPNGARPAGLGAKPNGGGTVEDSVRDAIRQLTG